MEETGTTGMYGRWEGASSKLWLALCSTGYTPKAEGEGGSFGYGKAGLIGGSKLRMVIAYTCFEERFDDPGVTRRLLGMTCWGQHELNARDFTGFARLGLPVDDDVLPFENDEADQAAARFGLDRRDAARPEDWGTSLLLVDPAVNAFDLERAICRNWWPALEDGSFHLRIETADGQTLHPRPKSDPILAPFHDAYEVATGPQDSKEAHRRRHVLHASSGRPQAGAVRDGVLGLVADPEGWSFPRDSAGVGHRSLVALVRRPRMVVEYLDAGRAAPFVRGVFVADDSVNEQLRQTEPKGHDAWQTTPDGLESAGAFELAASIQTRIKQRAAAFRRDLRPPPRPAEKYQLKLFDREMRRLLGGTAPSGPPPQTRPLTIHIDHDCRDTERGTLFVSGAAEIGLSPHFEEDRARVKVQIRFTLLEDGRVGKDSIALVVDPPDGFETRNGSHEGLVHRGEPVRFGFRTESYRADWSGRLDVRADPVSGASDQPQEEQGEA